MRSRYCAGRGPPVREKGAYARRKRGRETDTVEKEGRFNPSNTLDDSPFAGAAKACYNFYQAQLYELAIRNGEARVSAAGALVTATGAHTGRSANDKFTVRDALTENTVWWDNNAAMSEAHFDTLKADFARHVNGKTLYVQDLYGGADPHNRIKVRVITENAWHALFIRYLLRRPAPGELETFTHEMTILDMPSFKADPARHGTNSSTVIALNLSEKLVLIGDTAYAGEIKKSVFTTLNFLLPENNVLPMHCSCNVGPDGDTAVFFGLSGTGKTTLSSDPDRTLIGDDEHGWSDNGVFNFEGGCYAKTIRLSARAEPEIYAAAQTWGTILENVVIDPMTRQPDFDDASLSENGRAAYPLRYIPNACDTGQTGQPDNVIMLTADAFGVLPPIARLTPAQAMYHFLSGYTAKVAGTEAGVTEPEATFSACFGAPFMPRHPSVYGNMLRERLQKTGASCWLVNTGWTGGPYGEGHRMPIRETRALLHRALEGRLKDVRFRTDPFFGFEVPVSVPGVVSSILDPRGTWRDPERYDAQAKKLAEMFRRNFASFIDHVDDDVKAAGPLV